MFGSLSLVQHTKWRICTHMTHHRAAAHNIPPTAVVPYFKAHVLSLNASTTATSDIARYVSALMAQIFDSISYKRSACLKRSTTQRHILHHRVMRMPFFDQYSQHSSAWQSLVESGPRPLELSQARYSTTKHGNWSPRTFRMAIVFLQR